MRKNGEYFVSIVVCAVAALCSFFAFDCAKTVLFDVKNDIKSEIEEMKTISRQLSEDEETTKKMSEEGSFEDYEKLLSLESSESAEKRIREAARQFGLTELSIDIRDGTDWRPELYYGLVGGAVKIAGYASDDVRLRRFFERISAIPNGLISTKSLRVERVSQNIGHANLSFEAELEWVRNGAFKKAYFGDRLLSDKTARELGPKNPSGNSLYRGVPALVDDYGDE